ncbi:Ligand binding domain protein [Mactra antiquata]
MNSGDLELLYNRKSPLYNDTALRNLIHTLLVEQKLIPETEHGRYNHSESQPSCSKNSSKKRKQTRTKALAKKSKDEQVKASCSISTSSETIPDSDEISLNKNSETVRVDLDLLAGDREICLRNDDNNIKDKVQMSPNIDASSTFESTPPASAQNIPTSTPPEFRSQHGHLAEAGSCMANLNDVYSSPYNEIISLNVNSSKISVCAQDNSLETNAQNTVCQSDEMNSNELAKLSDPYSFESNVSEQSRLTDFNAVEDHCTSKVQAQHVPSYSITKSNLTVNSCSHGRGNKSSALYKESPGVCSDTCPLCGATFSVICKGNEQISVNLEEAPTKDIKFGVAALHRKQKEQIINPSDPQAVSPLSSLPSESVDDNTDTSKSSSVAVSCSLETSSCDTEATTSAGSSNMSEDVGKPMEEFKEPQKPALSKTEIEAMIDVLVKANNVFREFPKEGEEKKILHENQTKFLEKKKTGDSENEEETKRKIYESTAEYFEMRIREGVSFAKKIPGFTRLPLDDQVKLIKESRAESGIIGGLRGINTNNRVMSSYTGDHFTLEDMKLVYSEDLLDKTMKLANKIGKLNLKSAEEALLRALTIVAADRCSLSCRAELEIIEHKIVTCLEYVISNGGEKMIGSRLGKLTDILLMLRELTEIDMNEVKDIMFEWPSFASYKLASEFL